MGVGEVSMRRGGTGNLELTAFKLLNRSLAVHFLTLTPGCKVNVNILAIIMKLPTLAILFNYQNLSQRYSVNQGISIAKP